MRIVDSRQMQEMDRHTIEELGVPSLVLMENAARSWVEAAMPELRTASHIYIFCGAGNNGGDGYAIARILANFEFQCTVVAVKPPKSTDCQTNARIWDHYGTTLTWEAFASRPSQLSQNDVIIDAVLGTGIESELRGSLPDMLKIIDHQPGKKLAVDMPSGINASTGDLLGTAVKADVTITFQKEKIGHHLYPGKVFSGRVICQKISIKEHFTTSDRRYYLSAPDFVREILPIRPPDGYKNRFGHVIVWCGSPGTLGAAFLASHAGIRSGAGLLTAAIPGSDQNAFLSRAPEVMTFPQEAVSAEWLSQFSAVIVGCGLGRQREKWKKVETVLKQTDIPVLIDADGFYGITDWGGLNLERCVLTPHPGEFAKVSGFARPRNNREKIEQALAFIEKYPATLVLKGAPTMVFSKNGDVYINSTGNVGMATAGSGDVLAGIIGGWMGQGLSPLHAAILGTWLHGKSGDIYTASNNEESLTASCLIDNISGAINKLKACD